MSARQDVTSVNGAQKLCRKYFSQWQPASGSHFCTVQSPKLEFLVFSQLTTRNLNCQAQGGLKELFFLLFQNLYSKQFQGSAPKKPTQCKSIYNKILTATEQAQTEQTLIRRKQKWFGSCDVWIPLDFYHHAHRREERTGMGESEQLFRC